MNELAGRVAVVTGAASGIGFALATRLCAEGMKVVLADIEAGPVARVHLPRTVPNGFHGSWLPG